MKSGPALTGNGSGTGGKDDGGGIADKIAVGEIASAYDGL